jgi:hypothetical protein
MRNNKGILLMIVLAIFIIATCGYAQEEMLKLEHKAFENRQRPGVTFPHAQHFATIECTACHHFYVNGQNVWDESRETNCAACHGLKAEGKKMGLMKAFHENCVGCHRETKPAAGKSLPVMCGECHKKK